MVIKQGASDDVNRRRGAFAPAGVGGGFLPTTDGRMASAALETGDIDVCYMF